MTKYILDYNCGQKGDFLSNYFNNNGLNIENNFNKSLTNKVNLKLLSNYLKQGDFNTIEQFLSQDFIIISGMNLQLISKTLLEKYNCKVIRLLTEEKFIKTCFVECVIKHNTASVDPISMMKITKKFDIDSFKFFKKIKYQIDFKLIKENVELTDENRGKKIINLIETYDEGHFAKNIIHGNVYKILNYGDIYVNKKYDLLYEIKPDFDPIHYENLLEKTWLPDIVNFFGYDINLRSYGYRDY